MNKGKLKRIMKEHGCSMIEAKALYHNFKPSKAANNANASILVGAGFWWKGDDKSTGLQLMFHDKQRGLGVGGSAAVSNLMSFVDTVVQSTQDWIDAEAADGITLDQLLDAAEEQIEECAAVVHSCHTPFNLADKDDAKVATIIMMDILFLVSFGRIPDNNYNGTRLMALDVPYKHKTLEWKGAM